MSQPRVYAWVQTDFITSQGVPSAMSVTALYYLINPDGSIGGVPSGGVINASSVTTMVVYGDTALTVRLKLDQAILAANPGCQIVWILDDSGAEGLIGL